MPISMDISPLHRTVVIVASGHVTPEEIKGQTQALVDANVPHYGKIIDVSLSTSDLTEAQVEHIAAMLRGDPGSGRGPVASSSIRIGSDLPMPLLTRPKATGR